MAGIPVRELITRWKFNVDDKKVEQFNDGLERAKSALKTIGIVATAVQGTLFLIAKTTADVGDAAAKMSKSLGISADLLQSMGFAAQIGGITQQAYNTSIQKFPVF